MNDLHLSQFLILFKAFLISCLASGSSPTASITLSHNQRERERGVPLHEFCKCNIMAYICNTIPGKFSFAHGKMKQVFCFLRTHAFLGLRKIEIINPALTITSTILQIILSKAIFIKG
jgi:hypothetical protein